MEKTGTYEYLILLDRDDDPITIDWMNGGVIHKATQFERITAFQAADTNPELDKIVRANMTELIRLNIGQGLHIGRMRANFEVYPDVKRAENIVDSTGANHQGAPNR